MYLFTKKQRPITNSTIFKVLPRMKFKDKKQGKEREACY